MADGGAETTDPEWSCALRTVRLDGNVAIDRGSLGYGNRVGESTKRARDQERAGRSSKAVLYTGAVRDCKHGRCEWGVSPTDRRLYVCKKCGQRHLCDASCMELVQTREAWVCKISGVEKMELVDNGNFAPNAPTVMSPFDSLRGHAKRARRGTGWLDETAASTARFVALSGAIAVLRTLLCSNVRARVAATKITKARSSSAKVTHRAGHAMRNAGQPLNLAIITQKALAELERCGGYISPHVVTEHATMDSYAQTCVGYYVDYVTRHVASSSCMSRPKNDHCFLAIYYIMRDGMLDSEGNVAIAAAPELRTHLPDLKIISHFGFDIGKYTTARRFIQQAVRCIT